MNGDDKNKKISIGLMSDEAKKKMAEAIKRSISNESRPQKPIVNYTNTSNKVEISSKMQHAIRSLNEIKPKPQETKPEIYNQHNQSDNTQDQATQQTPRKRILDTEHRIHNINNIKKISDTKAPDISNSNSSEKSETKLANTIRPTNVIKPTNATRPTKSASPTRVHTFKKPTFDFKKKNTSEEAANEKKRLEKLQQQNKMIEKYGIHQIVKEEDSLIITEDENDFAEFHHEDDDFSITQNQIDEDDEKIFGKDLVIKSQEFDFILSPSSKRKADKRGRRKAVYDDVVRDIELSGAISVRDLAELISEKASDVMKALIKSGVNAAINDTLDPDTAELIATEMGHNVKRVELKNAHDLIQDEIENINPTEPRIPIVVVMGHVDHGKTSLLDAIRNADVASKEHGGITQHIGAYTVYTQSGNGITFLDTPGHAAFNFMRSRGANVTDVAILVIAGDDGIQPQTIETIEHIKKANVPMIIAITKMDKQDANPTKIKNDLLQYGVFTEEFSGDVMVVEVSSKNGTGIDKLLEAILLQAEMLDLKYDSKCRAFGDIIEAKFDKNRGSAVTIILRHGVAKLGDIMVSGTFFAKIKSIFNDKKERLTQIIPGMPAEIYGFDEAPSSGGSIVQMRGEKEARELIELREDSRKTTDVTRNVADPMSIFDKSNKINIGFVIKADTFGSLEAICEMINNIKHDQLIIKIMQKGIGDVTESDATLAQTTNSHIFGFHVNIDQRIRPLVEKKVVDVKLHDTIYRLMDDVKAILSKNLPPITLEELTGKAEVRQMFPAGKSDIVAGSMVVNGTIHRGFVAKIVRNGEMVHKDIIKTIRRFKDEVKEVKNGYDCGILINGKFQIAVGDVIECYEEKIIYQNIEI